MTEVLKTPIDDDPSNFPGDQQMAVGMPPGIKPDRRPLGPGVAAQEIQQTVVPLWLGPRSLGATAVSRVTRERRIEPQPATDAPTLTDIRTTVSTAMLSVLGAAQHRRRRGRERYDDSGDQAHLISSTFQTDIVRPEGSRTRPNTIPRHTVVATTSRGIAVAESPSPIDAEVSARVARDSIERQGENPTFGTAMEKLSRALANIAPRVAQKARYMLQDETDSSGSTVRTAQITGDDTLIFRNPGNGALYAFSPRQGATQGSLRHLRGRGESGFGTHTLGDFPSIIIAGNERMQKSIAGLLPHILRRLDDSKLLGALLRAQVDPARRIADQIIAGAAQHAEPGVSITVSVFVPRKQQEQVQEPEQKPEQQLPETPEFIENPLQTPQEDDQEDTPATESVHLYDRFCSFLRKIKLIDRPEIETEVELPQEQTDQEVVRSGWKRYRKRVIGAIALVGTLVAGASTLAPGSHASLKRDQAITQPSSHPTADTPRFGKPAPRESTPIASPTVQTTHDLSPIYTAKGGDTVSSISQDALTYYAKLAGLSPNEVTSLSNNQTDIANLNETFIRANKDVERNAANWVFAGAAYNAVNLDTMAKSLAFAEASKSKNNATASQSDTNN